MLSKQSDEMLSRLAAANRGLQEQITQLVNGNVVKHKRITADLHKRIRAVKLMLQQKDGRWQGYDERDHVDLPHDGQATDGHYPTVPCAPGRSTPLHP
eukprot:3022916-Karenia_brevis.AAC.1